jgi:hypothetical protein
LYEFHRRVKGSGYLVWANNNMVAAAIKCTDREIWLGAFNFADSNQTASVQFDNPRLPIRDDAYYKVVDPVYSNITGHYSYYSGRELKVSRINTIVSFTERYKLLRLERIEEISAVYDDFLKDSFFRLCSISHSGSFSSNFSFCEVSARADSYERLESYICEHLLPLFWNDFRYFLELGLKRIFYHMFSSGLIDGAKMMGYIERMEKSSDEKVAVLGQALKRQNSKGAFVLCRPRLTLFKERRSGQCGIRAAPRTGQAWRRGLCYHRILPSR